MELAQHRYMQSKKPKTRLRWLLLVIVGIFILLITYGTLALTAPVEGLRPELSGVYTKEPESVTVSWPKQGVAAIGSVDDGVLASSIDKESPAPIASMTKVVTALAVMERAPFQPGETGQSFVLDQTDVALWQRYVTQGGSVFPVSNGMVITQQQALEALLIISGNNIADSLANKLFGSLEEYITFANQLVSETYGLKQTTIADASGFSSESVSTPSDMIILGQKLLEQPVLAEIVAKRQVSLPGTGVITNTNRLLADDGIVGIKTGTTFEAGYCLLFAANHQFENGETTKIIGVVMGNTSAGSLLSDARSLLATAKQGFGSVEVVPAGTTFGMAQTAWGQKIEIRTNEPLMAYGWKGKQYEATPVLEVNLPVPINDQQELGEVRTNKGTVKIVSHGTITPPPVIWRLTNYF